MPNEKLSATGVHAANGFTRNLHEKDVATTVCGEMLTSRHRPLQMRVF